MSSNTKHFDNPKESFNNESAWAKRVPLKPFIVKYAVICPV